MQLSKQKARDTEEISGLWEPRIRMARNAVQLLDQHLRCDERGLQTDAPTLLSKPIWNEGMTLRPRVSA